MYKFKQEIICNWKQGIVKIGNNTYDLNAVKHEDAVRDMLKDNLDDTEIAQLRLAYPEWYAELFEVIETTQSLINSLKGRDLQTFLRNTED